MLARTEREPHAPLAPDRGGLEALRPGRGGRDGDRGDRGGDAATVGHRAPCPIAHLSESIPRASAQSAPAGARSLPRAHPQTRPRRSAAPARATKIA